VEDEECLEGPVLKVNGQLMLLIPLSAGGSDLVECSRGISDVEGDFLKIVIPEWLAGLLRIDEGDLSACRMRTANFRSYRPIRGPCTEIISVRAA
jgi:hypothetical protein